METTHTNGAADLEKRLQDPETREALVHLLDRLDTIDRAIDLLDRLERQWAPALELTVDVVDDELTRAADRGMVLDERTGTVLRLLDALTEPATADALEALLGRMEHLERLSALAEAAPGAVAVLVDVLDAEYARARERGQDPEQLLREAAGALGRLGALVQSDEFEALLDSGVLDPEALQTVGSLGSALVESQKEAQRGETPRRGLFGLIGALRDPDVQRAIGFITSFAKTFGKNLRLP